MLHKVESRPTQKNLWRRVREEEEKNMDDHTLRTHILHPFVHCS